MAQRSGTSRPDSQLRFDGRVAVVTGAGRGLGREYALLLASRGATVMVNDLGGEAFGGGASKDPAENVAAEIRDAGGAASVNFGDVSSEADTSELISQTLKEFGRVDIVVNNAGIGRFRPFDTMSLDEFELMLRVHTRGAFLVTRAAWPHMVKQGFGRIVMTSSNGMVGLPHLSHYSAAKAGVYGLMKSLSMEGSRHGITVNALWPNASTPLATAMNAETEALPREEMSVIDPATTPDLDGSPRHVAPVVAWLAHESCEVTGEVLHAGYGGVTRAFMVQGPCFASPNLTIEEVAEHWSDINRDQPATAVPSTLVAAHDLMLEVAAQIK